ncbi:MAG TPA: ABC transporter ATP-binding protein [Erysipelotrichaceae bacterium]|nr:ABC transporter ATP-binding protein [Erysipelotrichaceae bacterium]
MSKKLLEVKNLHTYFDTEAGTVKAVNGVDFTVESGKTLGIVGESGSGKSVTSMSVIRLLDYPGEIKQGEVLYNGEDLTKVSEARMRSIRGNDISVIFQEPMTSLNPVFRVGKQISEALILHQNLSKKEARERSIQLLRDVKIPRPTKVIDDYPHQLSGGMRQRVMIAMALACKPTILIADEPTTALDVTIQAQILSLMNDLKEEQNTAIMFITHDLGVINQMADDVIVMYCGEVVENAPVDGIFGDDVKYQHPYTEGLLHSIPRVESKNDRLDPVPGSVPHPLDLPVGCKFAPRCKYATAKCMAEHPPLFELENGEKIRCFYPEKDNRSKEEERVNDL